MNRCSARNTATRKYESYSTDDNANHRVENCSRRYAVRYGTNNRACNACNDYRERSESCPECALCNDRNNRNHGYRRLNTVVERVNDRNDRRIVLDCIDSTTACWWFRLRYLSIEQPTLLDLNETKRRTHPACKYSAVSRSRLLRCHHCLIRSRKWTEWFHGRALCHGGGSTNGLDVTFWSRKTRKSSSVDRIERQAGSQSFSARLP